MESKKRLHSGSSDVSDEHIDSLLGPDETPLKSSSKKSCPDNKDEKRSEGGTKERQRSGSGSPTKSWLDSPFALAEFISSKTSPANPTVSSDYKPLLGSNFKIPKKGEQQNSVDIPVSPEKHLVSNFELTKVECKTEEESTNTGASNQDAVQKTSLANALAQIENKKHLECMYQGIAPKPPKVETPPKIEYQLSIAEKLKSRGLGLSLISPNPLSSTHSSPYSSQPGSPITPGRRPLVPRCGVCAGCLRTEKCGECSSCLKKSGQCFRRRCVEKTKAANQRLKEKKQSVSMGYVSVSDYSDVESMSAVESPISNSPVNAGRCNECEGCTRTEDCGACFRCNAGKKPCYKRQCFTRKREAESRAYQNRKLKQSMKLGNVSISDVSDVESMSAVNSPVSLLSSQVKSTKPYTIKPSQKKCGTCEGCLADSCGMCNYCLSGNDKIMALCMKKRCMNITPITKRRVRCHECEGCKREDCGECYICAKRARGEQTSSFCTKKKCINFQDPTPSKKSKTTRCGECEGCNSAACGECGSCQKGYSQLCRAIHCKNPIKSENNEPKKPKMKRIRCGECTGCMSDPCGLCATCQKAPHLCKTRWCTNATMREVVKRERIPRTPGMKQKSSSSKYQKGCNPRRYKRCGECNGCKAPDCGQCASCKMNEQFGEEMVLGKAACLELVCEDPIDLFGSRLDGGESSGYYEAMCLCEGCTKEECGECENCKGDPKFGGTDDPPKLCVLKVCQKRTRHKNIQKVKKRGPGPNMLKMMAEQEDGTCPTRVINGVLYDFRCYFCKKLPRVGSANRSELYRHYAVYHYPNEIKAEFGHMSKCPHCAIDIKGSYVSHMGQKHNEVDKYLPEAARIPLSVQGRGGGGVRHRRGAVIVRKRQSNWIWPEIPEGFDPNGEERVITLEEQAEEEEEKLIVDGFEIENNYDIDEEPLLVSRDEPVTIPDHSGKGAICMACKSSFADVLDAVFHIHDIHNIKGGSSNIHLDTDRLMKCGYVNLTEGVTETVITEEGKKKVNPVQQMADQADLKKQPTARKSTTTSPEKKQNNPTTSPTIQQPVPQPTSIDHIEKENHPASIQDSDKKSADEESSKVKPNIIEAIQMKKMAQTNQPSKEHTIAAATTTELS